MILPLPTEGSKYVRLGSLDLICDHPNAFQEWIDGVREWLDAGRMKGQERGGRGGTGKGQGAELVFSVHGM